MRSELARKAAPQERQWSPQGGMAIFNIQGESRFAPFGSRRHRWINSTN
ncbi:MAG: hypothetical protein PF904_03770 [Kiritimatiellae bacterium]|nr:hypothetical protein [Kiritimatiellia bacterium]